MRLLFLAAADPQGSWRAGFDLAQAAAAYDHPLALGFAGPGLALICRRRSPASAAPFSSLVLLGLTEACAPQAERSRWDLDADWVLPLRWLDPPSWSEWLRAGALEPWP